MSNMQVNTTNDNIPKKAYKLLVDDNYEEGITLLKNYIKKHKDNPHVFNNLGAAYIKIGNYIEAEKYLNMALELPNFPEKSLYFNFIELNVNIGNGFINEKNYNMAIFYFKRALGYIYKYQEINDKDNYILSLKKELESQLFPK